MCWEWERLPLTATLSRLTSGMFCVTLSLIELMVVALTLLSADTPTNVGSVFFCFNFISVLTSGIFCVTFSLQMLTSFNERFSAAVATGATSASELSFIFISSILYVL